MGWYTYRRSNRGSKSKDRSRNRGSYNLLIGRGRNQQTGNTYAWVSRRPENDEYEDWDTGLFCWLDKSEKQFEELVTQIFK